MLTTLLIAALDTLWCFCAPQSDLASTLEDNGYAVVRTTSGPEALRLAPKGAPVLLLGDGGRTLNMLSKRDLAVIKRKRLRVFADYAVLPGTAPVHRVANLERVVVTKDMGPLGPMDLLTVNQARFVEVGAEDPCMVIARVAGFDTAPYGLEGTQTFPLVYKPSENLYLSSACLSDFSRLRLMPEDKWQAFWETVLSDLTGAPVRFGSWPALARPSYGRDATLPPGARREAVRRGVDWFYKAKLLIHPAWAEEYFPKYEFNDPPAGPAVPLDAPCGDGSMGIDEGHCSAIDADGNQLYRYCRRADVHGEAAMALGFAGALTGVEDYRETAERLMDYAIAEYTSGPRGDPGSPSYGLVSWMHHGPYRGVYYGDDNARFLLGAFMAAHLLGVDRWDGKLRAAVDGNFHTTGVNGFRGPRLEEPDIQKNGRLFYQKRDLVNPHPHFESWLWAVYLWMYAKTGQERYLELSEKGISLTMEAYPGQWRWTNGIQQERARMVLPLAWLYRVSPTGEHLSWLKTVVADLKANQVPCGAIREELGDPAKGQYGGPGSNADYGRSEAPLIFRNGDPVADMLYTSNFAIFGLQEAAKATGDPEIAGMVRDLADFLVRIQVSSPGLPNVDGAWYRAFNYRDWNYWASNADLGWGSLGTLVGWTQSWITSTLAMVEMDTSYWDLTQGGRD